MPKNNNQKQKNLTVDDLAVIVAHGFEDTKKILKKDFKKDLKKEIGRIEKKMVTKDHFDDTIVDLRGDAILRDRKIDTKVNLITKGLKKKKLIDKNIITAVENITIFPQITKGK